ncbi:MAG: hypothetical protein PHH14_05970 [Candidatus Margulisbacteria bacterium]|nr:hypothetical protein [Candidatus Margulisiibacteriota bacterium]
MNDNFSREFENSAKEITRSDADAMIDKYNGEIIFNITEYATVKSVKTLMEGIRKKGLFKIVCAEGFANSELVKQHLAGIKVVKTKGAKKENHAKGIEISFHDSHYISMDWGRFELSLYPFKHGLDVEPKRTATEILDQLNVGDRKTIVCGSLGWNEMITVMQSYERHFGELQIENRPLIVFAPRKRDQYWDVWGGLFKRNQILQRIDRGESLPPFPDMNHYNILDLSTSGELASMYSIGDMNIIGSDRNILEGFGGRGCVVFMENESWKNNWENNQEILQLSLRHNAAVPFKKDTFALLEDNDAVNSLKRGEKEVIKEMKDEIIPRSVDMVKMLLAWMILNQ